MVEGEDNKHKQHNKLPLVYYSSLLHHRQLYSQCQQRQPQLLHLNPSFSSVPAAAETRAQSLATATSVVYSEFESGAKPANFKQEAQALTW